MATRRHRPPPDRRSLRTGRRLLRACLEIALWVAQATGLCRPATRRTERAAHRQPIRAANCVRQPCSFRSAGRRPAQAGRPCHPFFKHALSLLAGFSLVGLTACGPSPSARDPRVATPVATSVVARVGLSTLSQEAFIFLLTEHRRTRSAAAEPLTVSQKEAVLEEWIRAESVYQQACGAGFDQRPDIAQAIRRLIIAKFQEEQQSQAAMSTSAAAAPVTADDVAAFYRQHEAKYQLPPAVRGAVIFLGLDRKATPEKRQARRAEAEALREEARRIDFRILAAQYSEDQATRFQGGDTGWLFLDDSLGERESVVARALSALGAPGDLGPVIEVLDGFYVARLLEKRAAGRRPLDEVAGIIRHQLEQTRERQRAQEFFARMRRGLDIQIDRAVLERVELPVRNEPPPAIPGLYAPQAATRN